MSARVSASPKPKKEVHPPITNPFFFVVGPPGSGKAVMSAKMVAYYECQSVSIGKLIRREVAQRTEFGKRIAGRIKRGLHPPIDMVMELLKREIRIIDKSYGSVPIILHGFPKNFIQLKVLETDVHEVEYLLELHVDVKAAQDHLRARSKQFHRKEDKPILIKMRCEAYERETQLVAEVLIKQGRGVQIDAKGSIWDTWRLIKDAMERRLKRRPGVRDADDHPDYEG